MLRKNKNKQTARNPQASYNRQQSYHYSSKRSFSDKSLNRRQVQVEGETKAKKNTTDHFKLLPSYFAVVLVLASFYYLLSLSTRPDIIIVNQSEKTDLIDKKSLENKTQEILSKNLANRFKPTFDELKVSEDLEKLVPEITSVEVKVGLLRHSPQIRIEVSEPSLVLSTGTKLFVVGSDGNVLGDITRSRDGFNVDSLPLAQDQTNIDVQVGKKILTTLQVDYIKEIVFQSSQKGLNVSSMIIQAGGSQLDVRYGGINYFVKFNLFENARESSGVFLATKARLDSEGKVPSEYIDVRVPERAYIK
jgi:hypothetical protein